MSKSVTVKDLEQTYASNTRGEPTTSCSSSSIDPSAATGKKESMQRSDEMTPVPVTGAEESQVESRSQSHQDTEESTSGPAKDENIPPESVVSTAFRIQPSKEDASPDNLPNEQGENAYDNANNGNEDDEPESTSTTTTTTLHFKSGLSLPISTQSVSNKKVIANAGKTSCPGVSSNVNVNATANSSSSNMKQDSSLPPSSSSSNRDPAGDERRGNDVHQSLNFSALSTNTNANTTTSTTSINNNNNVAGTPTSSNNDDQALQLAAKKRDAQRMIAESKKSASRAMMMTSSQASTSRLLKNLRVVFDSASQFTEDESGNGNKANAKANANAKDVVKNNKDGSTTVLTLDPSYLHERSGMQFLNDVESVIECELRKINRAEQCRFLTDNFRIQGEQQQQGKKNHNDNQEGTPQWLRPFLQSEDSEVALVLVLLAKIENSIVSSYEKYQQKLKGKHSISTSLSSSSQQHRSEQMTAKCPITETEDNKVASSTTQKSEQSNDRSTVPLIPVNESSKTVDDDDLLKSDSGEVKPATVQCLHMSDSDADKIMTQSFLANVFKTYKRYDGHKDIEDVSSIPHIATSPLRIQDLLLVPAERLPCVSSVDSKTITTLGKGEYINEVITKWNSIITLAKKLVDNASSTEAAVASTVAKSSDSIDEVVELFADEVIKVSTKSKKKKKKKKKVSTHFLHVLVIFSTDYSLCHSCRRKRIQIQIQMHQIQPPRVRCHLKRRIRRKSRLWTKVRT